MILRSKSYSTEWVRLTFAGAVIFSAFFRSMSVASENTDAWRSEQRCGINAAYAALQAAGLNVSYDLLIKKIPISEGRGTSLQELADAITDLGLAMRTIKASPHEFFSIQFPAIAHLEMDVSEISELNQTGHFVLVISSTPTTVRYLDGSSGQILDTSTEDFLRRWSGYLIIQAPRPKTFQTFCVMALALTAGCLARYYIHAKRIH